MDDDKSFHMLIAFQMLLFVFYVVTVLFLFKTQISVTRKQFEYQIAAIKAAADFSDAKIETKLRALDKKITENQTTTFQRCNP
jgi:hypothetical protein